MRATVMTLSEAIKHCEERANVCDECGREHKRLAKWLKELQERRRKEFETGEVYLDFVCKR